ncbi:AAA family ATPase [Demequina sp. SO4-18]|uniref:AAA family ATPase n=1 Tax=Demequina sp. SO4-18 TaxID=3401026 RepID=UPI003B58E2FC
MAAPGVIIAVAGPVEARVAQAIDGAPGLRVVRRCADLAEATAAADAGVGTLVVVSDQPHLTRSVLADLARIGVAVLGVPTTPEAAEQLGLIGIREVVAPSAGDAAIAAAAQRALTGLGTRGSAAPAPRGAGQPGSEPAHHGRVIAVWGPTGAPGRTTIAANLAGEVALAGAETLLMDADTYGGAVAQACGLMDEAPGLAAVARAAQHGALDAGLIDRYALEVAPRLRVLTGITRPERWTELPAAALDEVWRAARSTAAVTVVDCGFGLETDEDLVYDTRAPQRNGATLSALGAAHTVVAVGTAEPLGIQRLVHGLAALRERVGGEPVVVVNRVRAEVAGVRPEEAVADALLRFAQVPHTWTVPWDPRACDAAALSGQLLAERTPRSRARRAIAALAARLHEPADAVDAPRPPRAVAAGVGD